MVIDTILILAGNNFKFKIQRKGANCENRLNPP